MMILGLGQIFQPELKDAIDQSSFLTWAQRAPIRDEFVTFSHNNLIKFVAGRVLVYKSMGGYAVNYTAEEPFHGIWTRYEKPAYSTDPFTTITVSDDYPGEVKLWTPEGEPVEHNMLPYDVGVVVNFLSMRVDEKYADMLKNPEVVQ